MSNVLTSAAAPILKSASAAISAAVAAPASRVNTALAPASQPPYDLEPADLSPAQIVYLRALGSGKGIAAAAEEAGVTRRTAYRWQADPRFAELLSAWRNQSMESARHQLLTMAEQATAAVSIALKNGDVRVAIALLKGMGILSPKAHERLSLSAPSAM